MTAVNRLAHETSPYLRQHAGNPVDWYPWGSEALTAAREADLPVFISIGYASCHWCHVMAHESFEDPETAADLNRSFISVKVDREERPDVDAVYMAATLALSGQGGWPMSVFCTPDGRPFHAGTYYPPTDRHGMPSFRHVLAVLADAWRDRRADVESQADELVAAVAREVHLTDHLATTSTTAGADTPSPAARMAAAVADLAGRFDEEWGGFGPAPKFPRPALVELCLRAPVAAADVAAADVAAADPTAADLAAADIKGPAPRAMALRTLDAMAAGGMYDHLVGGFARYATDRQWLVPHFEKMLPDQALLARTYLRAWRATGDDCYLQVATETLEFVLRDLRAPSGGVWSSLDADADGREGSHATWTRDQVATALGEAGRPDLIETVCAWYGVTTAGNWEGTTILHRPLGAPLARSADVEEGRRLLAAARGRRTQPALDDKVLTEWNAMTAAVLAEGAMLTGERRWADAARGIAEMLYAELRRPDDGRWMRSYQDGRARHLALAADYAWVVECCARLGELSGEAGWTARAVTAADGLLDLFFDEQAGLSTTGVDAEALVVRPRDVVDGALPSATSVAVSALARVSALTGRPQPRAAADRLVELTTPLMDQAPGAVPDLLLALPLLFEPAEIVVTGDRRDLVAEVHRRWLPTAVTAWGEPTASPLWDGRSADAAFVCHHFACREPATAPDTLCRLLDDLEQPGRQERCP